MLVLFDHLMMLQSATNKKNTAPHSQAAHTTTTTTTNHVTTQHTINVSAPAATHDLAVCCSRTKWVLQPVSVAYTSTSPR